MRQTWLAQLVLIGIPLSVLGGALPGVEVVASFSKPRAWDGRVALPYFDAKNRLLWNEEAVKQAGDCSAGWFPDLALASPGCERFTVMLNPRVDECRCTGKTPAGVGSAIAYVGLDEQLHERWRRRSHVPGQTPGPLLSGANLEGLVFNNFEVWSPHTGETLRPAQATPGSFSSASYLPARAAYLKFDADVTLFRSRGGLYLHSSDGKRVLVLPVERTLFGYYMVESIAPVPGTPLILLGERYTTRGQGSARFELFDLDAGRVLFGEERSKGHYISEVRVVAGREGHVAFSFLDESAGKYWVVHYRIR